MAKKKVMGEQTPMPMHKRGQGAKMPKSKTKQIYLSASSLSVFIECPRCFWLEKNENILRPRGVFPSLPGGMDDVIKKYFDKFRKNNDLPPEVKGKIKGDLFSDSGTLNKWRNWRIGLSYEDKKQNAKLVGALDDCLVYGGKYIPLDYKTRGYAPKENSTSFYQHQLDIYAFLLTQNGFPAGNFGYLLYYYPEEVFENGNVRFAVEPKEMKVNSARAEKLFNEAIACLGGDIPSYGSKCVFCDFSRTIINIKKQKTLF